MNLSNQKRINSQAVTIINILVILTVLIPVFSTGTQAAEKSGINQECNISDLIKQLNTRHRASASRQLVKIGDPAVDAIVTAFRNPSCYSYQKRAAAETLAEINSPKAVNALIETFMNQEFSNHIRCSAARGLGLLKNLPPSENRRIEALLIWVLQDKGLEDGIRGIAAWALGNYGSERATAILTEALSEKTIQNGAAQGLARIALTSGSPSNSKALKALMMVLKDKKNIRLIINGDIRTALVRNGKPEAVTLLIAYLEYKNYYAQRICTEALLEIGEPAVAQLIEALKHKSPAIRRISAMILGKLKSNRALLPLVKCLKSTDWMLRDEAAVALVRINSKTAIMHVQKLLKNSRYPVRQSASWVLARLKH